MPPKRTTNSSTKQPTKRRFSTRLNNGMLDENIDMANGTTQPKRSRRSIKTPTNKSSLNVVDNADLMIDDSEFPFLYFISKITIEHCLYLVEEHQADSSTSIVSDLADDNSEHLPSYSSPSLMNRV